MTVIGALGTIFVAVWSIKAKRPKAVEGPK
jgi:hypothetical protein